MIKLFISYSHKDEALISKFNNHISPLKSNGTLTEWYDRKIETGEEFQNDIDNNLGDADVICLMISDNFLSSKACLSEKDVSLSLRNKKGIRVIPVILSHCLWTEHKELSELLAVPTDGKAITSFADQNEGWVDAVKWIKQVCISVTKIKSIKLRTSFNQFLNSADILSKSHKDKETLNLNDVFVYPRLKKYDGEELSHKYHSENFKNDVLKHGKIIIAGENQSGKTTLCKVLFKIYRDLNCLPIYLEDEDRYLGNPYNKLEKAFIEQYEVESLEGYDIKRVIPIVDNFHLAKYQEKYVTEYDIFKNQVLTVDDIFGLNFKNQNLIKEYNKFKIREFTALERNELIKKWIQIKEDSQIQINPNYLQQSIDEKTELIENSLGIIFGKGIMPSYPFFILSLLAAQDTQKPLDQEITSQGHCYQALIYLYLRKEGVKNDQIDIYSNFLTELAFWIYNKGGNGLSHAELQVFLEYYQSNFNLPIPIAQIIKTLSNVNIAKFDTLNHFSFCYTYIYYFFVARFISDPQHLESKKELINNIISNLHKDENAYITVFITHHTKSNYLLDELLLHAEILFERHKPATLDSLELSFFDKHEDKIIQAILPSFKHNSDDERNRVLVEKSEIEDNKRDGEIKGQDIEENTSELARDLRLSIKTVEVMGLIIKNRSGSLDLKRLEYIYEQGLKVHLRILTSFIEIIKDENAEKDIVELLKERLDQTIEEKESESEKELSMSKIEKLARSIFWNLNFGVIHGFITKSIHSLGSSNLLRISQNVSNNEKTPSAFIVNQGINMWYAKNLRIDEIADRIADKDFSKTAEKLIKFKVVEHCRLHNIAFKDLQRIEDKLNLQATKLLVDKAQNK